MKNIIKRILKEETQDEFILEIPNLRFIPNVDLKTPEGMTKAWNELLRLLKGKPFSFDDDLNLLGCKELTSLGNLQSVGGDLDLSNTKITSLGNLKSVVGYLDLYRTELTSLGDLQSVGGYLDLFGTNITSLGNLQSVNGYLDLRLCFELTSLGNLQSVGGDLNLRKTPLSKKYSEEEIRQMVDVKGEIII